MHWINGEPQEMLPAADRAVQFGDGCFTTARVRAGEIDLLPWHLERLQQAAQRLQLQTVDWLQLRQEMQQAASGLQLGVIKVILSRGCGGRGYGVQGCGSATRIVSQSAYPQHYLTWRTRGISLALSPITLARSRWLAGIKHLNRLEQVLIRLHLEQSGADEALVLDTDGWLVECCAANLFWRRGRDVFTPNLEFAGVAGVMRRRVIALLADSAYRLHEVSQPPSVLAQADELLVCNALMPLLPVNRAEGWHYRSRQLFELLSPHC